MTMIDSRFAQLTKALAEGWEIEEPVLIRATWPTDETTRGVYHFVLRKKAEGKTSLLSLFPSPQLMAFLQQHDISINTI